MTDLRKELRAMSDAELEEEAKRRRRMRASGRRDRDLPRPEEVMKWYASLELEPGASIEEIEDAYERLSRKYHPDKHKGDDKKHRMAVALAASLEEAYRKLAAHVRKRRKS